MRRYILNIAIATLTIVSFDGCDKDDEESGSNGEFRSFGMFVRVMRLFPIHCC